MGGVASRSSRRASVSPPAGAPPPPRAAGRAGLAGGAGRTGGAAGRAAALAGAATLCGTCAWLSVAPRGNWKTATASTRSCACLRSEAAAAALSSTRAAFCCVVRSEEHTSELQSHLNLVCRLLLEKKKQHHLPLR